MSESISSDENLVDTVIDTKIEISKSENSSIRTENKHTITEAEILKLSKINGAVDILLERSRQSLASCKARSRYELQSVEWEKALLKKLEKMDSSQTKYGNKPKNMGSTVTGIFRQNKAPTAEALDRIEQEARVKAKIANEQLFVEEIDNALKWHLGKYSYAYECTILSDALTVKPNDKAGLMDVVSGIDNVFDLQNFLSDWCSASSTYERKNNLYHEYKMSPAAHYLANRKQIFGIPLCEQLDRDNKKVPTILVKCAEIVELNGLQNEGIYRLSGQSSAVNKIRSEFDFDAEAVNLAVSGYLGDINNITGVLKMYFRELPGSLIPETHSAALSRILNDSKNNYKDQPSNFKKILNTLPPGHYNTLSYLMNHLNRVQAFQEYNMMSGPNLAIVFGPTLVSTIYSDNSIDSFKAQTKIVEFMLKNTPYLFPKFNLDKPLPSTRPEFLEGLNSNSNTKILDSTSNNILSDNTFSYNEIECGNDSTSSAKKSSPVSNSDDLSDSPQSSKSSKSAKIRSLAHDTNLITKNIRSLSMNPDTDLTLPNSLPNENEYLTKFSPASSKNSKNFTDDALLSPKIFPSIKKNSFAGNRTNLSEDSSVLSGDQTNKNKSLTDLGINRFPFNKDKL
ncbi:N-chimaerin [Smittium mucronatum]|uniref:N-chimaerin n=1 Tax=Smittium mucronatum TaxID=133383 RepID=A0A1R0GSC5_9FUNG|nr:N-chimaerin [Smittium mucronatum]